MLQQHRRWQRTVFHPLQCHRDEPDDHERIEGHRGEHGRRRRVQSHDVEGLELRVDAAKRRGHDREILGDVVGEAERRQAAPRHQELLANGDDLEQLRGVAVEIDHVAGFLGRLRAGIHGHGDVGLCQGRGVVGAVTGHRDEVPFLLVAADHRQLRLGRGLCEEVVDARLGGDRGGGKRIVAGDHHGADSHRAELLKAFGDAPLHDVLQFDHAQHARTVGDDQRRGARLGHRIADSLHFRRHRSARRRDVFHDRVAGSLANHPAVEVDATHPSLRSEGDELRAERLHVAAADAVPFLGQHDDRPAFRGFVGEARQLGGIGEIPLTHARRRQEVGRLPVAECDCACLVEQEHVHVAGGLHRAAAGCQDIGADHAVDAGDADRWQQSADRGGGEADEERREHRQAERFAAARGTDRIHREGKERGGDHEEDECEAGQENVEGDLVGRLLSLRALHHRDHLVEKTLAGIGRDPHHQPVGEHPCAAGDRVAVAAALTDHRRALAGDRALVHGGDAVDHLAVTRHDVARFDQHVVAAAKLRGRRLFDGRFPVRRGQPLGERVAAGAAQGVGLCPAAALRHRLGEIREEHRRPEPGRDGGDKGGMFLPRLAGESGHG